MVISRETARKIKLGIWRSGNFFEAFNFTLNEMQIKYKDLVEFSFYSEGQIRRFRTGQYKINKRALTQISLAAEIPIDIFLTLLEKANIPLATNEKEYDLYISLFATPLKSETREKEYYRLYACNELIVNYNSSLKYEADKIPLFKTN